MQTFEEGRTLYQKYVWKTKKRLGGHTYNYVVVFKLYRISFYKPSITKFFLGNTISVGDIKLPIVERAGH